MESRAPSFDAVKIKKFGLVYLCLVGLAFLINWPGRAVPDTVDMLYQARNLSGLNDWHAPFVTFAYGLLGPALGYPAAALLLQAALLMLWPALILSKILCSPVQDWRWELGLAVWLLVSIAFVVLCGQIVKDVLLIGFGSALLFVFELRGFTKGGVRITALLLVIAMCLIRPPNVAIFALCALVVVVAQFRNVRSAALALIIPIAFVGIGMTIVSKYAIPSKDARPEISLIMFDLAGISAMTGSDLFSDFAGKKLSDTPPSQCYTPTRSSPFLWGDCKEYWEQLSTYPTQALTKFWISSVLRYPFAYLEHRLRYTKELLINDDPNDFIITKPPFTLVTNHPDHIDSMAPALREVQLWRPTIAFFPFGNIAQVLFSTSSPIMQPVLWLALLSIAALIGVRRLRDSSFSFTLILACAGLGNFAIYAALGPADNLRYLFPTMFCALIFVVDEIGRWSKRGRSIEDAQTNE